MEMYSNILKSAIISIFVFTISFAQINNDIIMISRSNSNSSRNRSNRSSRIRSSSNGKSNSRSSEGIRKGIRQSQMMKPTCIGWLASRSVFE